MTSGCRRGGEGERGGWRLIRAVIAVEVVSSSALVAPVACLAQITADMQHLWWALLDACRMGSWESIYCKVSFMSTAFLLLNGHKYFFMRYGQPDLKKTAHLANHWHCHN